MTGPAASGFQPATASFSAVAWQRIAGIRAAIDELPLLRELADATLPEEIFAGYLMQDALYLIDYARTLAIAAAQAPTVEQMRFWIQSSRYCLEVEPMLHVAHVRDPGGVSASPTTVAYTSYLLSLAAGGDYPVLAAGVLPCYWIYDDIGTRLRSVVGEVTGHPYGDWINLYGNPEFAASTKTVRGIVDELADRADPGTLTRRYAACYRASQYEWMFWDAAYRREGWPVGWGLP